MNTLSLPTYENYLNTRLSIISERHRICQEVIKSQQNYDYWTYNYLYYLYALNAESLNHLRTLFHSAKLFKLDFYDFLTCTCLKVCVKTINYYGVPKDRTDHTTRTFAMNHPDKKMFFIPNFSLPVVTPTQLPPTFEKVESLLNELFEKEEALTHEYDEL